MKTKSSKIVLLSGLMLATAGTLATEQVFAAEQTSSDTATTQTSSDTQANADSSTSSSNTNSTDSSASSEEASEDTVTSEVIASKVDEAANTTTTTYEIKSQALETAKSAAEAAGVTVTEEKAQEQPSIDAAAADNKAQAEEITKTVKAYQAEQTAYETAKTAYEKAKADYETAKANYEAALEQYQTDYTAYEAEKKEYEAKLKAWQEYQEQVANGTAAGRVETAQGLVYQSEPKASISLEGVDSYITKEGMQKNTADADVLQHYNTDKYTDDMLTSDNPYSSTEDTWFKMTVGQTVTATYSGLTNSSYGDKKITKVIITYTLNSSTSSDGTAIVELYHDPTKTIFIGAQVPSTGEKDPISVTMQIRFFDENDEEIDMTDNKAIMSLSSLNHWTNDYGDHIEKVSVGENEFIKIPGSSVDLHDGYIYSINQNQKKSQGATFDADGEDGWDAINADGVPRAATAFYGAGAMTYKGKAFTFTASGNNPYVPTTIWFSTNSVVAVPENPGDAPVAPTRPTAPKEPGDEPVAPTAPSVTWHKNYVVETTSNNIPTPTPPTTTVSENPKDPTPPAPRIPVQVSASWQTAEESQTYPETLPVTGDDDSVSSVMSAVGLLTVSFAAAGLLTARKRKERD